MTMCTRTRGDLVQIWQVLTTIACTAATSSVDKLSRSTAVMYEPMM